MRVLSHILSPVFGLIFFFILLIFHPVQWICLKVFGYSVHKTSVDLMNYFLVKALLILGIRTKVNNPHQLPQNTTLIFVSNHQSLFDIPPMIWTFRKHHPKFVSKIELGKGIPSVSFNLRHSGAALINRKDSKQALSELGKFAKRINKNNWSAVIFPEGTRSRNGQPRSFSPNGLKMLSKYNPEGYVVPLTVNNSWKVFRFGKYPCGLGSPISIEVHEPIRINAMPFEELLAKTEQAVKSGVQL